MDTKTTFSNQNGISHAKILGDELDKASDEVQSALGSESPLLARLCALRKRLQQRRLQIAVLGQFKRGKSTFVNALLGASALPVAVVPQTAIPTFITWGDEPLVEVHFADGRPPQRFKPREVDDIRQILTRFVTEEANPKNCLHVDRVDLSYCAEILAGQTVLIDTPGIGSTLTHNTETALRVLPECDASFFVVSADPPITETEIAYLKTLKSKVGRTFFIVNKIDYLSSDELRSVVEFLRNALSKEALIEPQAPIFCVSARLALSAKLARDQRALIESGMLAIEDHVARYLATEKTQALIEAIKGKSADLIEQAKSEVELRARAFTMPLEELQQKSSMFAKSLGAIEDQRITIGDLLSGAKRRVVEDLEARISGFRGAALHKLSPVIDAGLSGSDSDWQDSVKSALSSAIEQLFVDAAQEFVENYSSQAERILANHKGGIDALIERVRDTAAQAFDVVLTPEHEPDAFRLGQEPYWFTERIASRLIPDLSRLVDRLLPAKQRRRRRRQRVVSETEELILRNAENLRWAILRGLDETFRTAIAHFERKLGDAIMATKGVIEDALAQRRDRSFSAAPVLDRLQRSIEALNLNSAAIREIGS